MGAKDILANEPLDLHSKLQARARVGRGLTRLGLPLPACSPALHAQPALSIDAPAAWLARIAHGPPIRAHLSPPCPPRATQCACPSKCCCAVCSAKQPASSAGGRAAAQRLLLHWPYPGFVALVNPDPDRAARPAGGGGWAAPGAAGRPGGRDAAQHPVVHGRRRPVGRRRRARRRRQRRAAELLRRHAGGARGLRAAGGPSAVASAATCMARILSVICQISHSYDKLLHTGRSLHAWQARRGEAMAVECGAAHLGRCGEQVQMRTLP